MKSRPDPALDIRSVHEAGHAIAAVRNRVAFSSVSIERAKQNRKGKATQKCETDRVSHPRA